MLLALDARADVPVPLAAGSVRKRLKVLKGGANFAVENYQRAYLSVGPTARVYPAMGHLALGEGDEGGDGAGMVGASGLASIGSSSSKAHER